MKTLSVLLAVFLAMVVVVPAFADCGSEGDIVWSEIDYDQTSTDALEFIELRFPNGGTFSDCYLQLVNQTSTAYNDSLNLGTLGTIPANSYIVWGGSGVSERDVTIQNAGVDCASNCIQNGPQDGFVLHDGTTVIWYSSYDGVPATTFMGSSATDIGCVDTVSESCNNGPTAGLSDVYLAAPTPGNPGTNAVTFSDINAISPALSLSAALMLTGAVVALRKRR